MKIKKFKMVALASIAGGTGTLRIFFSWISVLMGLFYQEYDLFTTNMILVFSGWIFRFSLSSAI